MSEAQPTSAMVVIGDEILSGRTRDSNMHHLAQVLTEAGAPLREVRVVADDRAEIIAAVRELSGKYDHVFTSGGIGPTHDDITAESVAAAFDTPISVRDDARAILLAHYGDPEKLTEPRLRMARIPEGAELIANPISGAPGFKLRNVHVMAGVPIIFNAMVESLRPTLKGGPKMLSHAFRIPVAEGDIAGPLTALAEAHPEISFGSYPFYQGGYGSTVVARSTDAAALAAAADGLRAMCEALGAKNVTELPPV
ncbi:MAG: molybdopterin-binding protein [Pseudomonadota bacterium]|nr:molybdopterin-binding protein [Pseudomonadota bacterium]